MSYCPFCDIVRGEAPPPERFYDYGDVVSFEPLNPVVPGHTLVVPKVHVVDYVENPLVTGRTFQVAAQLSQDLRAICKRMDEELGHRPGVDMALNVISSAGADATQTVFHLHVHVVPRLPGDGLHLPWTSQHAAD